MTESAKGGDLLKQWITISGRRYQWVAEAVGLAQSKTIKRYISSNQCPRSMAMAIELLTYGEVPADTWEWK